MFKFAFANAATAVFPRAAVALPRPAATVRVAVAEPTRFEPPASFQAVVRAKRLGGSTVRDDRYTATLPVSGGTPYDLISALAEACSSIQELCSTEPGEEKIVLEISLTR